MLISISLKLEQQIAADELRLMAADDVAAAAPAPPPLAWETKKSAWRRTLSSASSTERAFGASSAGTLSIVRLGLDPVRLGLTVFDGRASAAAPSRHTCCGRTGACALVHEGGNRLHRRQRPRIAADQAPRMSRCAL